jgi:hypothetical protein
VEADPAKLAGLSALSADATMPGFGVPSATVFPSTRRRRDRALVEEDRT